MLTLSALEAAKSADVSLPFGGVPTGIKELEQVKGWPDTGASLAFANRVATVNSNSNKLLFNRGGVVPVGLTTASEFGGLNVSITKLNGVTHNPWRHGRTVGGSSGGAAASVAGGLVSLATGGDGGGSIRIPAGYTGLLGMKGTFGRITRGPVAFSRPNTVVQGNLSRSVRDAARFYDVCAGVDPYDPTSLPSAGDWEANLGTHDLAGLRVAVVPNLGGVTLEDGVEQRIRDEAAALIADNNMVQVNVDVRPPNLAAQWMMGNLSTLLVELGDMWPKCAKDLTDEVAIGLYLSQSMYNLRTAAVAEEMRVEANQAMARAFEQVDLIIAASNPGPAFPAESSMSSTENNLIEKAKSSTAAKGRFAPPCLAPSWRPRLPPSCRATCWAGSRRSSPRWSTWARSPSSPTSTATPLCRSRPGRWAGCRWACRFWPATMRTRCSSTWPSPSSGSVLGPWWHRRSPTPRNLGAPLRLHRPSPEWVRRKVS